jgi:hypothetical protein
MNEEDKTMPEGFRMQFYVTAGLAGLKIISGDKCRPPKWVLEGD